MKKIILFIFSILTISNLESCGVKTAVVAPQSTSNSTSELNLDCSPNDPNCDAIDPNYIPSQSE